MRKLFTLTLALAFCSVATASFAATIKLRGRHSPESITSICRAVQGRPGPAGAYSCINRINNTTVVCNAQRRCTARVPDIMLRAGLPLRTPKQVLTAKVSVRDHRGWQPFFNFTVKLGKKSPPSVPTPAPTPAPLPTTNPTPTQPDIVVRDHRDPVNPRDHRKPAKGGGVGVSETPGGGTRTPKAECHVPFPYICR